MSANPCRPLLEGLGVAEGPVLLPGERIACCSIPAGEVLVTELDGGRPRRIRTGGGPNGMALGPDGNLYVAQNGGIFGAEPASAGVQVVDPETGSAEYIVTVRGAPNDICFGPDGRLYFTDPRGESDPTDPSTSEAGRLYRCAADGTEIELLLEGPAFINGLAFELGGDALLIAETARRRLLRLPWSGAGVSEPAGSAVDVDAHPDGFAFDAEGRVWVAATFDGSIRVLGPEGQLLRRIELGPGHIPTNCCLSPSGQPHRLYVTTAGSGVLLELEVGASALPLFPFR